MARHFVEPTFANAWQRLLTALILEGETVSPRGHGTREIMNVTFEVTNGLENILVNPVRDLNYRFMIGEWLWIYGGLNDVASIARYNSVMKRFSDDDLILSGAYGPRLQTQWYYVLKNLAIPDSRQAVSTIWTPSPQDSKDIPCTISMQWMIRRGLLHCTINMRSSDVWLGLPYDFFTFSQLTNIVSSNIGVPVGSITMNLASSHIYDTNVEKGTEAMFDVNYRSIRSPALSVYAPSRDEIVEILDQKVTRVYQIDEIWSSYAVALTKNSRHALEVLDGLDPSK